MNPLLWHGWWNRDTFPGEPWNTNFACVKLWWLLQSLFSKKIGEACKKMWLVGWWFGTCFIFPYIVNNHHNWLLYFAKGLKPRTRCFWIMSNQMKIYQIQMSCCFWSSSVGSVAIFLSCLMMTYDGHPYFCEFFLGKVPILDYRSTIFGWMLPFWMTKPLFLDDQRPYHYCWLVVWNMFWLGVRILTGELFREVCIPPISDSLIIF